MYGFFPKIDAVTGATIAVDNTALETMLIEATNDAESDDNALKGSTFVFDNPCPNEECWDWALGHCELKAACANVACSASEMTVYFLPELYGTVEGITPKPNTETITIDGTEWHYLSCPLGGCDMTYGITETT